MASIESEARISANSFFMSELAEMDQRYYAVSQSPETLLTDASRRLVQTLSGDMTNPRQFELTVTNAPSGGARALVPRRRGLFCRIL